MSAAVTKPARNRWLFRCYVATCAALGAAIAAGAVYRLRFGRDDPVLVHFSNLGNAFAARGDTAAAVESYRELLKVRPASPQIQFNLANTLAERGERAAAIEHYREALQQDPGFAEAHYNLANLLAAQGSGEDADAHYRAAERLRPGYADAHYNRGILLARLGRADEAIVELEETIRLRPADTEAHFSLGMVQSALRRYRDAAATLALALDLAPAHARVLDAMAWLRATAPLEELRSAGEAVKLAERAAAASSKPSPQNLDTLAAAYAESRRFDDAVRTAGRALELARASGEAALAGALEARLRLYRARQPYRDPR